MALPNPAVDKVPTGYKYGWNDPEMKPLHVMKKGLSRETVEEISRIKGEPQWMTDLRLKAYRHFEARPMPTCRPWAAISALKAGNSSQPTSALIFSSEAG